MRAHNNLINKAKPVSDCHISQQVKNFARWQKEQAKWKPGYNELQARRGEDHMLAERIKKIEEGKVRTTDCYMNKFCEQQRQYRRRNPRYLPGKHEQVQMKNARATHNSLVKSAAVQVDSHLGIEHKYFYDFKKKHGGVLPPLNYETPEQQLLNRTDPGRTKRRKNPPRSVAASSTRARSVAPSAVQSHFEQELLIDSLQELERDRGVDSALVQKIYNIGKSAATNEAVKAMLFQQTQSQFPDILEATGQIPTFHLPGTRADYSQTSAVPVSPTQVFYQTAPSLRHGHEI